jgi:gamma-glutamyltranspeptidase/glutathione hydrolase
VRQALDEPAGIPPAEALPGPGGTVYVAVADEAMTVSLITSNYYPFGSAVGVERCGFVLQNRGACFRPQAPMGHPNRGAGGVRPFHTIMPALLRRHGGRYGALGIVGGPFQPQGHVQVLHHLSAGLDPQQALDAPRWHWLGGRVLAVEDGLSPLGRELAGRGHDVCPPAGVAFGGAQLVLPEAGFWYGATETRQDGIAAGL